jgi:hypothetical protein
MGAAIFNILMGVGAIIGGLSGKLTLFGTQSSTALVVLGGGIAALGVWQLIRNQRGR